MSGLDAPTQVYVDTMIRSISKIDDYKMVSSGDQQDEKYQNTKMDITTFSTNLNMQAGYAFYVLLLTFSDLGKEGNVSNTIINCILKEYIDQKNLSRSLLLLSLLQTWWSI